MVTSLVVQLPQVEQEQVYHQSYRNIAKLHCIIRYLMAWTISDISFTFQNMWILELFSHKTNGDKSYCTIASSRNMNKYTIKVAAPRLHCIIRYFIVWTISDNSFTFQNLWILELFSRETNGDKSYSTIASSRTGACIPSKLPNPNCIALSDTLRRGL